MTETARQAQNRVVAPLLREIASTEPVRAKWWWSYRRMKAVAESMSFADAGVFWGDHADRMAKIAKWAAIVAVVGAVVAVVGTIGGLLWP